MAGHPLNLALRFLLEISALFSLGYWAYHRASGSWRIVLCLALPLLFMLIWATFAVPNDPSRSGNAPIPINGILRLFLEWAFFGMAVVALRYSDQALISLLFGILVIVHYVISYERILWLVNQ